MDLKEKVLEYKDEVVKEIQNAVRVKSVKEASLPGMPFGEGPAKALDHFMDLAKKLGFKKFIIPEGNYKQIKDNDSSIKIRGVKSILEAMQLVFS